MANDLLEDNGCLVVLQGIDDAFAMELFSFARGDIVCVHWPKNIFASTPSFFIPN